MLFRSVGIKDDKTKESFSNYYKRKIEEMTNINTDLSDFGCYEGKVGINCPKAINYFAVYEDDVKYPNGKVVKIAQRKSKTIRLHYCASYRII